MLELAGYCFHLICPQALTSHRPNGAGRDDHAGPDVLAGARQGPGVGSARPMENGMASLQRYLADSKDAESFFASHV
jgi:hypothetical protein